MWSASYYLSLTKRSRSKIKNIEMDDRGGLLPKRFSRNAHPSGNSAVRQVFLISTENCILDHNTKIIILRYIRTVEIFKKEKEKQKKEREVRKNKTRKRQKIEEDLWHYKRIKGIYSTFFHFDCCIQNKYASN